MTKLLEVHNRTPCGEAFRFEPIQRGLTRAGTYRLEYELQPALPGVGLLTMAAELRVFPGPLARFDVQVSPPHHLSCSALPSASMQCMRALLAVTLNKGALP